MSIQWNDQYSVGVKEIDDQHKLFVEVLQKLSNELISGVGGKEVVSDLMDSLGEYVDLHFNTEEFYFKKFGYEGTDEHIKAHNEFREKAKEEISMIKNGGELTLDLINYLETWLANHIMDMDQKYVRCFADHGLK